MPQPPRPYYQEYDDTTGTYREPGDPRANPGDGYYWDPYTGQYRPNDPPTASPAPAPTPAPGSTAGGGGAGAPAATGTPFADINNVPNAPDYSFMTDAPAFNAPTFSYDRFQAPDGQAVLNDPGYQFRLNQGQRALEQSAAARGLLRTGGTLKDILGYGQNLASQEYGNVYDRRMNEHMTGYNNALQAYQQNYQAAKDTYAPQLTSWQNRMQMLQRAADLGWGRAWDKYQFTHPSATTIYQGGLS